MTTESGSELLAALPDAWRQLLERVGRQAAARGEAAYLVGGTVRDLVLEVPHLDLDVVVEGDGMAVAQAVARASGGILTRYHDFQTARVDTPEGIRLDVATARSEVYPRPGQLPRVVAGTLEEDLGRRDFTINTLALALAPGRHGELIDPHGGLQDLRDGVVRVLHRRSFADDPTRILRALRFVLRLDYRLDRDTEGWLGEAIAGGYLDGVSGDRLRRELAYLLSEAPVEGPVELARRSVLAALHQDLRADAGRLEALRQVRQWLAGRDVAAPGGDGAAAARESAAAGQPDAATGPADATAGPRDARRAVPGAVGGRQTGSPVRPSQAESVAERDPERVDPGWPLVLAVCASELAQQQRWDLARRLRLSRQERQPLIESGVPWGQALQQQWGREAARGGTPRPSEVERGLRELSEETLLVGLAEARVAGRHGLARAVEDYLREYRQTRPWLDGNDLLEMGVPQGPAVGELLDRLRAAHLDGGPVGEAEERAIVDRWLAEAEVEGGRGEAQRDEDGAGKTTARQSGGVGGRPLDEHSEGENGGSAGGSEAN